MNVCEGLTPTGGDNGKREKQIVVTVENSYSHKRKNDVSLNKDFILKV